MVYQFESFDNLWDLSDVLLLAALGASREADYLLTNAVCSRCMKKCCAVTPAVWSF